MQPGALLLDDQMEGFGDDGEGLLGNIDVSKIVRPDVNVLDSCIYRVAEILALVGRERVRLHERLERLVVRLGSVFDVEQARGPQRRQEGTVNPRGDFAQRRIGAHQGALPRRLVLVVIVVVMDVVVVVLVVIRLVAVTAIVEPFELFARVVFAAAEDVSVVGDATDFPTTIVMRLAHPASLARSGDLHCRVTFRRRVTLLVVARSQRVVRLQPIHQILLRHTDPTLVRLVRLVSAVADGQRFGRHLVHLVLPLPLGGIVAGLLARTTHGPVAIRTPPGMFLVRTALDDLALLIDRLRRGTRQRVRERQTCRRR